jgi:hypothetical protein
MEELELLTFDESFFLLLSLDWKAHFVAAAAAVHCQPSIHLCDQEH